ncbi:hypothetical protein AB1N83_012339 [Pleurotus pulmonarius]
MHMKPVLLDSFRSIGLRHLDAHATICRGSLHRQPSAADSSPTLAADLVSSGGTTRPEYAQRLESLRVGLASWRGLHHACPPSLALHLWDTQSQCGGTTGFSTQPCSFLELHTSARTRAVAPLPRIRVLRCPRYSRRGTTLQYPLRSIHIEEYPTLRARPSPTETYPNAPRLMAQNPGGGR